MRRYAGDKSQTPHAVRKKTQFTWHESVMRATNSAIRGSLNKRLVAA